MTVYKVPQIPKRVALHDAAGAEIGVSANPLVVSGAAGEVIGTVAIDQTTDGVTNGVSLTNPSIQTAVSSTSGPWILEVGGTDGNVARMFKTDGDGHLQIDVLSVPTIAVTGTFWQTTQPVSISSMPSTPVTGTFWQVTQPVSIASMPSTAVTGTFWQATQPTTAVGTVADDDTTPGAPVMIGGKAVETDGTDPTSVSAEADVARCRTDRNRRLLVNTAHPFLWTSTHAETSAQTDHEIKAATGDAGLSLYLTDVIISNGATAGTISLEMDTASAKTVIVGPIYCAINGGAVINFVTPIRVTANKNIGLTSVTVTTHSVTINGYTAP